MMAVSHTLARMRRIREKTLLSGRIGSPPQTSPNPERSGLLSHYKLIPGHYWTHQLRGLPRSFRQERMIVILFGSRYLVSPQRSTYMSSWMGWMWIGHRERILALIGGSMTCNLTRHWKEDRMSWSSGFRRGHLLAKHSYVVWRSLSMVLRMSKTFSKLFPQKLKPHSQI